MVKALFLQPQNFIRGKKFAPTFALKVAGFYKSVTNGGAEIWRMTVEWE